MQDLALVEKAFSERAWYPLAAALLTLVISLWRLWQPAVWDRIPEKWQWLPAVLVSTSGAFVDAETHGKTLLMALAMSGYALFSCAMTSIGILHTAKRMKAFVQKPPSAPTVISLVLCAPLLGCSSLPKPRSVSDVAHELCESVLIGRPEVVADAKRQGLNPLDVARALCITNDVVRPFLANAEDAGDEAVGSAQRAGLLHE